MLQLVRANQSLTCEWQLILPLLLFVECLHSRQYGTQTVEI